jgi:predicted Co/Zn/Cd cation transporter (cation efflux family)
MSRDPIDLERRGLLLSVVGALANPALGFGFAAATGSAAVLLDGIYSLIGFAVGLVAMRVATLVRRPDDESFHFGYAAYEPMLNFGWASLPRGWRLEASCP